MTLIKSISGIRGTIGGRSEDGLNPLNAAKYVAAYAMLLRQTAAESSPAAASSNKIVVGRDARRSGPMLKQIVLGTLTGMGFDVIDIDMATTPTVEMAVIAEKACGGIILTASHNPGNWNALKFLNKHGELLGAEEGQRMLAMADGGEWVFPDAEKIGRVIADETCNRKHIESILQLALVDVAAIRAAGFRIAIDAVNSVGGIILPDLLRALGVKEVVKLHCTADGHFAHNPEPLPENLTALSDELRKAKGGLDAGFAVDPDVDRLAIVCENGEMFGEEYTLVAVSDYVLSHTPGNTVSNLSSSRALRDVTLRYGGKYSAAAVGEANVVATMKATQAVIGGEGNGGVIYPASHYGRDALVGIALFLTHLAKKKMKASELRASYPSYYMCKRKLTLPPDKDADILLKRIKTQYVASCDVTDIDGVKIDFPDKWAHLRKSNTEPILRIYTEARTQQEAEALANEMIQTIESE